LRATENEFKRRDVKRLVVVAQQPFQLTRPREVEKDWAWPGEVPVPLLFDPVSTVSATYGVAFQTQFRDGEAPWSSRPAAFVIDRDGVIRSVGSRPDEDLSEGEVLQTLSELEEQRGLITALQAKGEERRAAARVVLAPLSPRSRAVIPTLVKSLKDEDAEVRAGAAAALLWMVSQAEEAIPALAAALQDQDGRVRRLAVTALGHFGARARAAVPALVKALEDEVAAVRAGAARALTSIGPQARAASPALIKALKDRDVAVRVATISALERVGPVGADAKAAARALLELMKGRDWIRWLAAAALERVGTHADNAKVVVPVLLEALKGPNVWVRNRAATILKRIDSEAAKNAGVR
jgi:HEAT repeat protein/peroxiredoxin